MISWRPFFGQLNIDSLFPFGLVVFVTIILLARITHNSCTLNLVGLIFGVDGEREFNIL